MKKFLAMLLIAALLVPSALALVPEAEFTAEIPISESSSAFPTRPDEAVLMTESFQALYALLVEKLGDWEHIWDATETIGNEELLCVDVSPLALPYTDSSVDLVIQCLLLMDSEHPEIFYIHGLRRVSYANIKGVYYINALYFLPYAGYTASMRAEVETRATEILTTQIAQDMTDLEKLLVLHDYLITNIAYNKDVIAGLGEEDGVPHYVWNVYGALVKGDAVCQGYALSYKLLLDRLGVPCKFVPSDAMHHAWNVVQLDGEWYHVDVTFDDPAPDAPGYCSHDNFLLSDAAIRESQGHYGWVTDVTCSSTEYESNAWAFRDVTVSFRRESAHTYYYIDPAGYLTCGPLEKTGDEPATALEQAYASGAIWMGDRLYYVGGRRTGIGGTKEKCTVKCCDLTTKQIKILGNFEFQRQWNQVSGGYSTADVLFLRFDPTDRTLHAGSGQTQEECYSVMMFTRDFSADETTLIETAELENGLGVGLNWAGQAGEEVYLCAAWFNGRRFVDVRWEKISPTAGAQWVVFSQPRSTQYGEKVRVFLISGDDSKIPLTECLR